MNDDQPIKQGAIGVSSSDIIDNTETFLTSVVQEFLPKSRRLSSVIGYLFLSGLQEFVDSLASVDEIRLLIGNTSTRETIEQLAEAHNHLDPVADLLEVRRFSKRSERAACARQTAEHIRDTLGLMDQGEQEEQFAKLLIELINSGQLRVRVYTRGRLNGRAHIFDYRDQTSEPGVAIVGSSNLTLACLRDPTELNVVVRNSECMDNHAAVTAWFERLWNESQDFNALLMHELEASWAAKPVSPWDIYLKTLYTLVKSRGDESDEALFDDEITQTLTDFQRVAVQQAVSLIRRYNGCFVADVVGLGKSFIGAAIIKHFERSEGRRTLIVCPKPLEEMWTLYNERYGLNAAIVPMSMLLTSDRGIDLFKQYPNRDLVLIDESHGFRNPDSQRYEALSTYLQADDRKLCLLTATPRNSRAWDVFHQIKLFHPEDVSELPIDPPDLRAFFKGIEDGSKSIKDVLRHVMIRRTRRHILRWWGVTADTHVPMVELDDDDARPYLSGERRCFIRVGDRENYFPRRVLETVRYSIEDTYEGLYEDIRGKLAGAQSLDGSLTLTYARYGLWEYLHPELRDDERYADLRRTGKSLRGLIRVMLFKRLESSVAAFRTTVERLLSRHELFARAIEEGMVPAGEDAEALLGKAGKDDDVNILYRLASLTQNYHITDFDSEKLQKDLYNDIAVLRSLLDLVDPITAEQDDKVQTLLSRLRSEAWAGRKILVFTQFADTAKYLGRVIDPDENRDEVEVMFGQNKSKARVVGRFAPKANPALAPKDQTAEIMILVTTDVLSEGLNMQDCDLVVNYDLHWNPVRLIQRLGRIDRIGSEHEEIYAINFLPETGIEQNLGILALLRQRIAEIHETIGEDAQILEEDERLNEEAMFAIYEGDTSALDDPGGEDETLDLNEAEEVLRHLEREDPEEYARIASLRDGIRSSKPGVVKGVFALCQAGEFLQPIVIDESGEPITSDLGRILQMIKSDRHDPSPASMPIGFGKQVQRIRESFAETVRLRATAQGHGHRFSTGQKYVLDHLVNAMECEDDEGRTALLSMLKAAFSQTPTPAVRKELQRLKKNEVTGHRLVDAIQDLYTRHRLRDRVGEKHGTRQMDVPRIICCEALK